jgi:glucosyl-3-phosphoglycerate synthase
MEEKVKAASAKIPVGVLIPALYRDLSSDAMHHIIEVLADTSYVRKSIYHLIRQTKRIISGPGK